MTQPEYQAGSEPMWWWKVAMHLDEAQLALTNAMAHNVDDPRPIHALHDRLREGQAILLEIFRSKSLLPGSTNGTPEAPRPQMPPMPGMPGMPMPVVPVPAEQAPPLAAEEPAVPEADQDVVASEPEQSAAPSPEAAATVTIAPPVLMVVPPAGAGG